MGFIKREDLARIHEAMRTVRDGDNITSIDSNDPDIAGALRAAIEGITDHQGNAEFRKMASLIDSCKDLAREAAERNAYQDILFSLSRNSDAGAQLKLLTPEIDMATLAKLVCIDHETLKKFSDDIQTIAGCIDGSDKRFADTLRRNDRLLYITVMEAKLAATMAWADIWVSEREEKHTQDIIYSIDPFEPLSGDAGNVTDKALSDYADRLTETFKKVASTVRGAVFNAGEGYQETLPPNGGVVLDGTDRSKTFPTPKIDFTVALGTCDPDTLTEQIEYYENEITERPLALPALKKA